MILSNESSYEILQIPCISKFVLLLISSASPLLKKYGFKEISSVINWKLEIENVCQNSLYLVGNIKLYHFPKRNFYINISFANSRRHFWALPFIFMINEMRPKKHMLSNLYYVNRIVNASNELCCIGRFWKIIKILSYFDWIIRAKYIIRPFRSSILTHLSTNNFLWLQALRQNNKHFNEQTSTNELCSSAKFLVFQFKFW